MSKYKVIPIFFKTHFQKCVPSLGQLDMLKFWDISEMVKCQHNIVA